MGFEKLVSVFLTKANEKTPEGRTSAEGNALFLVSMTLYALIAFALCV